MPRNLGYGTSDWVAGWNELDLHVTKARCKSSSNSSSSSPYAKSMSVGRTVRQIAGVTLFTAAVIYLFSLASSIANRVTPSITKISKHALLPQDETVDLSDKAVIVASIKGVDVSWVRDELFDWKPFIYVADDPTAALHTQTNKGHEGNAYLRFLIEHYERLPATMVFLHHHAKAAHIDNAFYSNANSVNALNLSYVQRQGYASLRCQDEPGCICAPMRHWSLREDRYDEAWEYMFPGERVPDMVVAPCCGQFAVSRAQVLARPKSDYQRYHAWLMQTELPDQRSGRIMEYMWHIIFGRDGVHCLDERRCYCEKFGLCDDDPKRGFHPKDFSWLNGHACAKSGPNGGS